MLWRRHGSSPGSSPGSRARHSGLCSGTPALEIALALLDFHGAFLVVIDDAVLAFAAAELNHLLDDFGQRVGLGTDGPGAIGAAQRAHAAHHHPRRFPGKSGMLCSTGISAPPRTTMGRSLAK